MAVKVLVYDNASSPVSSSTVQMLETNSWGVTIDVQTNARLGPSEYGATLRSPVPPEPVHIWIDDLAGIYAPAAMGHLDGGRFTEVRVALYPLPATQPGAGGGGPPGEHVSLDPFLPTGPGALRSGIPVGLGATYQHISRNLSSQNWTEPEALGVRHLLETVIRARSMWKAQVDLDPRLSRWSEKLLQYGINVPRTDRLLDLQLEDYLTNAKAYAPPEYPG